MPKDKFLTVVETGLSRDAAEERLTEHAETLTENGAGSSHYVKVEYQGPRDGYGIVAYERK